MHRELLYVVGAPIVTFAALLVISRRPWRRGSPSETAPLFGSKWIGGVGFGLTYLIVHIAIHGPPVSSTLESWERLLFLVPLAAVLGVFVPSDSPYWWKQMVLAGGLAILTGWLMVPDFQTEPWLWRSVVGGCVFLLFCSQTSLSRHLPGVVIVCNSGIVFAMGVPILIASANAKFAMFSGGLAVASGIATAYELWWRDSLIAPSAIPVVALLAPSLLLSGYFNDYGDVAMASFLLLAFALSAGWIGVLFGKLPRWASVFASILAVAALNIYALVLAWPALTREPTW